MQAHKWDPTKEKLKKRFNPELPGWNFKREFGIPRRRTMYVNNGTWGHLNIKTVFPRYGNSHVKDKKVLRPSYLYHGDPYTGKSSLV